MTRRYLFGPVTPEYAEQHLQSARQSGACVAFNAAGNLDQRITSEDNWESVAARWPAGWQPDYVVLYLPYTSITACLWSAPVPIVGLAADWNLLWHYYCRQLVSCDLILTDSAGVSAFHSAGLSQARAMTLYGCGRAFVDEASREESRDIDILFVGNLNSAVQRERLGWLGRLARLAERYHVAIRTGVFGGEYRKLLRRARIAFNRSIRGEANQRAFEAAASGALLFQESENQELPSYFADRQECVYYTNGNLEKLLAHYLEHESEREAITAKARLAVQAYSFAALWQKAVELIDREWPALVERAGRRPILSGAAAREARLWQHYATVEAEPGLARDLAGALVQAGEAADSLHNALGLVEGHAAQLRGGLLAADVERAAGYFQRALVANPDNVLAGLNLVECQVALGQPQPAIERARQTLQVLQRLPALGPSVCASGHFPTSFDLFRVEWERAAWSHAEDTAGEDRAKQELVRWRLHQVLADLTGELEHYHEAAVARSDLPVTRAMLGCALARTAQVGEALPHLRQAVQANPFDLDAARALYHAWGSVDKPTEQRRLARDRRLLAQAAPQIVPTEEWFATAVPVGDELASILVLCCNQIEYSRQCLDSVRRQTRPPYELIIVNNGSTDGTAALLDGVRQWTGPARVEVITNEKNVGYPAGCNQALARARGRYVVFLNNDTVVTAGWLDRLIACSLYDWPQVGMVGAVTNYSRPPQQIAVDYADLGGLEGFAARRRRAFSGQALAVERLTGFCLLARREVLEQIGGYDEQFGLGFFDDDDLSVRALKAGFRLLVALDVFVHHFGSRTFAGLGIDCARQLTDNLERFRAKWGPEHTVGYQLPPPAPYGGDGVSQPQITAPANAATAASVSLCLIVKNEEANLADCLASVGELASEIVVVDTGSSDRTKEIAAQHGAKVFDFPWVDSFAAARNESLRHATGEWIFWMDADDRLDGENRQKLRSLLQHLPATNVAFSMKCLCLPDPVTGTPTMVDHVRLFRNHPEIRWKYRVHEQILPAIRRTGGEVRFADVIIQHTGYQDRALRGRKLERDLRLLKMENQEQPDDPFTLFNLGSVCQEQGRLAEALAALRRSLALSQPADSIVRKLYALIAQCHRQLGQPAEALAACQGGRRFYPDDVELLFHESQVRREQGDAMGAEACLIRLLERREGAHFASIDVGLAGYKARHNLAVLCQEQGRQEEAEAHWRAAVAENAQFTAGWLGLAELFITQERWEEAAEVVARLAHIPQADVEREVLQARLELARQDFVTARTRLQETIRQHPQAAWPRRLLSRVLLKEGRDWSAAEGALRDLLELLPDDLEAKNNLAVLCQRQGRAGA